MKPLIFSLFTVLAVFLSGQGNAQIPQEANTINITDHAFTGRQIPGMIMMNGACAYGENYHYKINSQGELRLDGDLNCGQSNIPGVHSSGGQQICYLNYELACKGTVGVNAPSQTPYKIDEYGVTVNSNSFSWADPQKAIVLLPIIKERAEERCDQVLDWEEIMLKHPDRNNPSFLTDQSEADCKPILNKLCSTANGGPVRLSAGKDISDLCQ